MDDFDIDPEIDDLLDDADADVADAEPAAFPGVAADGTFDIEQPPDPFVSADATVRFGGTVSFEDGTTVENPYTDAQGQVYKDRDSYIHGVDPHVVDDSGNATSSS